MRVSQLFVAAGLAVSVTAGVSGDAAPPASLDLTSTSALPVATAVGVVSSVESVSSNATVVASSHSPQTAAGPSNQTTTQTATQSTATPEATNHANATSSKPADATGGAILPQMQGSMAGLLGFCIMSLMLL
ncbi:hypothetical protein PWT90_00394 [Aphanocladium album]|nr:hypothetical protein PWT90_00394 [Aphanocladium album]